MWAWSVVGGAIVVGILNNWRNGVYFFLTWLLFEDFARKFLGNNMAIYFAKDFWLLVVYISFLAAFRRKKVTYFRPPFLMPVLIFIGSAPSRSSIQLPPYLVRSDGFQNILLLRSA